MSSDRDRATPRLRVVPVNDAEAVEIRKLLGEQGEAVAVSRQRWGASWAGLEPEVRAAIAAFRQAHPGGLIYGVELSGPDPYGAVNIDHHRYGDEDRGQAASSLEQVAALVPGAVPLGRWRNLVALNDRGYIPAMESAGATWAEIEAVRRADREAQGVTAEQEAAAERDLAKRAEFSADGQRVRVECPDGSSAAHADRLYGRAREILLMAPGEWNYYGPRHRELAARFAGRRGCWSGGAEASGYFGIAAPDEAERRGVRAWWEAVGRESG